MKSLFLFTFLAGFGTFQENRCALDSRSLTERLFNNEAGTIISCKILSYEIDESKAYHDISDTLRISKINFSGTPSISKAQITYVYFGSVDTSIVTLHTSSAFKIGEDYLIYTANSGKTLNCGGLCDQWTKKIDYSSPVILNELKLLQQFSEIKNHKKSGKYVFENKERQTIAEGQFKKGVPIKIWKHYYDTRQLKSEYDFELKNVKMYYPNEKIRYNGSFK